MTIFNIFTLLGGLALFLYGMNVMGAGLEKLSGGKLEKVLESLTSNKFKAVLLGTAVTAIIQSSSATTVMVVGFVNSGIMKLSQAIGIIFGANMGTTMTAWILSLSGIEGDTFWVQLLKPSNFSPTLAFIGIIFVMFSKKSRHQNIGSILIGFAVLMFGMDFMSEAVEPLKDIPEFANILLMFKNPILGVLAGAFLTAIIQSSSASVGILQALSATGAITFGSAIPIILGQNIGTCVTAMISSVGTTKNAKRAAFVHLYFNIIGSIVVLAAFYIINYFVRFEFVNNAIDQVGIAIVHTSFNVISTFLLLPFTNQLEKLAKLTVRDDTVQQSGEFRLLDDRFLDRPAFAIDQCKTLVNTMGELAQESLALSLASVRKYDAASIKKVEEIESKIDEYEDKIGTYLVRLSTQNTAKKDSRTVSLLLHTIGNLERISDHAVNITETAQEIHSKKIVFTPRAYHEIDMLRDAVSEIVDTAIRSFKENNIETASSVEPLEEVIDNMCAELKDRHIQRLQEGECTILAGFVFNDLLTNLERVSDHCSNIAVTVIQAAHKNFETHEYLSNVHKSDTEFKKQYNEYSKKYMLP